MIKYVDIFRMKMSFKSIIFCTIVIVGVGLLLTDRFFVNTQPITNDTNAGSQQRPEINDLGEAVQNLEGESYVSNTNSDKSDLIVVTTPKNSSTVSSPIKVEGQARGIWFFEGSFPIIVVDWDGRIIGEGYAQATNDWMTEDFVPFTGVIRYSLPTDTLYKRGAIIFKKDNPSGLPKYDDAIEIPVIFE